MLFGLPWWALIPLSAIIGGLFIEYRKQELKAEEKRMSSSKEINELRKIIHNLKGRIDDLEATVSSNAATQKKKVPLDDIEIKDDYHQEPPSASGTRTNA